LKIIIQNANDANASKALANFDTAFATVALAIWDFNKKDFTLFENALKSFL
jgi:hypothetical protein